MLAEIPCLEVRTDLAFDGTNLWQIAGLPKRIVVVEPATGDVQQEIPLGRDAEHACGLAITAGKYYVAFERLAKIEAHNQGDRKSTREYAVLPRVAGLEIVEDTLWYTEYEKSLLVGLDLASGQEIYRFRVPGNPTGLCWDGERFWYSNFTNRVLSAVRPP